MLSKHTRSRYKTDLCNYLAILARSGHSARVLLTPDCCPSSTHTNLQTGFVVCPPLWSEASVMMSVNCGRLKITNLKNLLKKWQYIAWITYRLNDNLVTNFWLDFKVDPLRYFENKLTFIKSILMISETCLLHCVRKQQKHQILE